MPALLDELSREEQALALEERAQLAQELQESVERESVAGLTDVASRRGRTAMTTLELKLDLPERLVREAQAAGLLTPKALRKMLEDAMQRRAAQTLLAGAARGSATGVKPLSMKEIQATVNAVRRARRTKSGSAA